jgi:UDP-N-acetylglucosamine 2-epimerase (non-hydrolysing)
VDPKKILVVFGTRPEAIKLAPVIQELRRRSDGFVCQVCVTAQHRQMLDQVMDLFGLKADFDLNIMGVNQTLAQITIRALQGLDEVIIKSSPDVVLVQGDTTTSFCGALAAFYHKVQVGHVEAGLRTGNKLAPFPEEVNRRLVTQVTDYHFAPTEHAQKALLAEGVPTGSVFLTGNTVIDALLWVRERVRESPPSLPADLLKALDGREIVLVTGHRRESFGQGFKNICEAIREIADTHPEVAFVYPVHLNPNVREPVNRILRGHERIHLIEPLPYASFVWLMNCATVVLTDSGGVQEEAPSLGKPVLVMRVTTERPEGLAAGNARLVGVRRESIASELHKLLSSPAERAAMSAVRNPYGDGLAAVRIADALASVPSGEAWRQRENERG